MTGHPNLPTPLRPLRAPYVRVRLSCLAGPA